MIPLPLPALLALLGLFTLATARMHYNQEPRCESPAVGLPWNNMLSAKASDCLWALTTLPQPRGDDRNNQDPDILIEGTLHNHAHYGSCVIEVYDANLMAPFIGRRELIEAVQAVIYSCTNADGYVRGKKSLTPSEPGAAKSSSGMVRWESEVRVWPHVFPPGHFEHYTPPGGL
ncbi:hypothetical protein BJ508DRAFT_336549 [Ascobolus immersus RN42]|uniref:Ecp2 effector protein domain-containing protein n=1 Tax=Ascobolus immersus RN42 TaxID=1160509 RepID=A0A3N4HEW7_ASCIM|nr:hypothetical protein BJ508DRAFT_336549 [Ascobolus immersus RN42]